MTPIVKDLQESNVSYKQLLSLIHESFRERINHGIHFSCSDYTLETLINKTREGHVLVALDKESNLLLGTATLFIKNNGNTIYGYNEIVAISDKAKRSGIGSSLIDKEVEIAKRRGCEYILSDTSVLATSSVNWHKRNGFNIIGLESYRSTNYWSYVFRKQLSHPSIWDMTFYRRYKYIKSFIFIRTTRNIHGQDTLVGKVYKRLKK